MADPNNTNLPPFSPEKMDMSKLTVEELLQLKDAILARARRTVDAQGTGFNPIMMASGDSSSNTQDGELPDWWQWIEDATEILAQISQQVSLAVLAGATAIAGGILYNSQSGERYAGATLAVAAVLGVSYVVTSLVYAARD
jgi:hypothetical protein